MAYFGRHLSTFLILLATACLGCGPTETEGVAHHLCREAGQPGATVTCLPPTMSPQYYVEQAEAYFDTLDLDADRDSVPNYHPLVARWEWPPWLLLTGFGDTDMVLTSDALRDLDPSTVPVRDCRFFEVQPFARCYVEFEYERGRCPIYEEFTFDNEGRMTFIEAWSDLPGLLPNAPDDPWAQAAGYPRLSTKVPGLGRPDGQIDLDGEAMLRISAEDPDVADFAMRAQDWRPHWVQAYLDAEEDFFGVGCGWAPEQ